MEDYDNSTAVVTGVPGHSQVAGNEMADDLIRQAAQSVTGYQTRISSRISIMSIRTPKNYSQVDCSQT